MYRAKHKQFTAAMMRSPKSGVEKLPMISSFLKMPSAIALCALCLNPIVVNADETEKPLPVSTTNLPMEAVWDSAPETARQMPEGVNRYYFSRWGGIVIRGKRSGDRLAVALAILHCGATNNRAMNITLLGFPDPKLCRSIKQLAPGQTSIVSGDGFNLYGTSHGWTVVDFAQKVGDTVLRTGLEPAGPEAKGGWGITHFGAVYHDEYGKHVFYAPGETVDLGHDVTFLVKPKMDEQELQAYVVTAGMRAFSDSPKPGIKRPVPWVGLAIIFGIPLALIAGLIYGIRRWILRRRKQRAAQSADLPTPK